MEAELVSGTHNSRVKAFGNGTVDIGGHGPQPVFFGSIEGDGNLFLGYNTLQIGYNPIETVFSGVIQDAGIEPDSGGRLVKSGVGTLRLTGANTYMGPTSVRDVGPLLVNNAVGSGTGGGHVAVSGFGVLGGTGTITGPVEVYETGTILGGDPAAASGTLKLTNDLMLHPNSTVRLVLGPSGTHATLRRLGGTWTFAKGQTFSIVNLGAEPGLYHQIITGLASNPGGVESWTIESPGFAGTFSYLGGAIDLELTKVPAPIYASFGNISTRLRVETADNVLIGGFIITGTQPKRVIVRAIGPSLSSFFSGVLGDPVLQLIDPVGNLVQTNDNWRSSQEAEIIATGVSPNDDLESAIVATLPAHGAAYTAVVRGVNDSTGVGVVEVYDLDRTVDSKLANISTRGFVQTGDDILIGGLIVLGEEPSRVIVRAIGPSLSVSGALPDPTLELHDGSGALIVANDNWRSDQETEIIATGIPPSNDLESAIVQNLAPGNYTAIVRGVNGITGVALVEAYGLN